MKEKAFDCFPFNHSDRTFVTVYSTGKVASLLKLLLNISVSQRNFCVLCNPIQVFSDARVSRRIAVAATATADKADNSDLRHFILVIDCHWTAGIFVEIVFRSITRHHCNLIAYLQRRHSVCSSRDRERTRHQLWWYPSRKCSSIHTFQWFSCWQSSSLAKLKAHCRQFARNRKLRRSCWDKSTRPATTLAAGSLRQLCWTEPTSEA